VTMGDVAIRVEGLGKRYRIGERMQRKTFAERVGGALYSPFKRVRSGLRAPYAQEPSQQVETMMWA